MILNERDSRHEAVIGAARMMMTAARTAPKARGNDLVEAALIEGDDIDRLREAMLTLHSETGLPVYQRDAANLAHAEAVVVIGIKARVMGLNCGHCGHARCGDKPAGTPCAFNATDVGIAIGSAVSKAADLRVDTRVMFSAGMGATRLGVLPECSFIYGIPVSASSKNPFFDRG